MQANASLKEFYQKFFAGCDVAIDSIEVLTKLLKELNKSKSGAKDDPNNTDSNGD